MSVTIAGCTPKQQLVYFAPYASFTAKVEKTWFAWQDPDRWELKLFDEGVERAHWIGIGNELYILDYSDSIYWRAKNPGLSFNSVIDARKLYGQSWKREGERYRVLNKNYESERERIQHFVWIDPSTSWPLRQELIGDTGKAIATYSGINTTVINVPINTKLTDADPFLLPNSMTATYSVEMQLKGLPMIWPFFKP